eukprot:TRINITY_DN2698_c0_g1_i1.p1 TRINITY_DN2698_c0_g1~~TRINITY_DN2698_c0_g1_i1.p1  ORF type:complete len:101 (+),score=28.45 TRINITY_DN2698_c0_g1_i1:99-401(+)
MEFIQEQLKAAPVVVFSKTYCPYCTRAKQLLRSKGAKMIVIELDERSDTSTLQDALQDITGARSVPRIFIAGKSVGGCDDIHALDAKGELDSQLRAASAL